MHITKTNDGVLKINLTITLIKYLFGALLFLFGLMPLINSLNDLNFTAIIGVLFIILGMMVLTSKNMLIINTKSRQISHHIWTFFGLINRNIDISFDKVGERGFYVHLGQIKKGKNTHTFCYLILHTINKSIDLFSCPEMFKSKLINIVNTANECLQSSGVRIIPQESSNNDLFK